MEVDAGITPTNEGPNSGDRVAVGRSSGIDSATAGAGRNRTRKRTGGAGAGGVGPTADVVDGTGGNATGAPRILSDSAQYGADQIVVEQAEPADDPGEASGGFDLFGLLNAVTGATRAGSPAPDRAPQGAQKIATNAVGDVIDILDAVAERLAGPEAGIQPTERFLINNGATKYLDASYVKQIAKFAGPGALFAGLGLWAWRIYETVQAKRPAQAPAVKSSQGNILSMFRPSQPAPTQPAPASRANGRDPEGVIPAAEAFDWQAYIERG